MFTTINIYLAIFFTLDMASGMIFLLFILKIIDDGSSIFPHVMPEFFIYYNLTLMFGARLVYEKANVICNKLI